MHHLHARVGQHPDLLVVHIYAVRDHEAGREDAQPAQVAHGRQAEAPDGIRHLALRLRQMDMHEEAVRLREPARPAQQLAGHGIDGVRT